MKNRISAAVALAILTSCQGALPPPVVLAIDPAFSELERAVIVDAADAWCLAVGWCPEIVPWTTRGAIEKVPTLGPADCEFEQGCIVAGTNNLRRVKLAADSDASLLWTNVAHELGHYCADHTETGLMAEVLPADAPLEIDATAIEAWHSGSRCSHH